MPPTLIVPKEQLDYPDYVRLLRNEHPDLADEVADYTSVKEVLDLIQRRDLLDRDGIDMVGQDEFHYDWLIQLKPSGHWVVFGVT